MEFSKPAGSPLGQNDLSQAFIQPVEAVPRGVQDPQYLDRRGYVERLA